ncbi:MAG: putative manganese-dependent inorganic diphosphatase [Spirochaeta sp.]|jgi:manganese-dependent inorganic pyrophosphatase|nr:putative manganese-dependent inorganic diphosphatase [Spirochaeta sp.]
MNTVYVAGHKNPDMDCTCAAYCYAALKKRIDPETVYTPVRTGPLNAQIRDVFELAGVDPPRHVDTVAPTVEMVAKYSPVVLKPDDPVLEAIREVENQTISAIPILEADGTFAGVVGVNEITSYILAQNKGARPLYTFLVKNFSTVLPGRLLEAGDMEQFEAPIVTGSMPDHRSIRLIGKLPTPPLLVVGNRPEILEHAVESQLPAVVITGLEKGEKIAADMSDFRGAVFLSSTDTAETIRILRLSSPISTIMDRDVPRLAADTTFEQAKNVLLSSKYRGLPVFRDDAYIGMVSRRSFIERPRRKLILVDHNEVSQAVDGAEQSEILEIVDHHRLAPPSTTHPIAVTTRAVGSTCTLVYEEFAGRGLGVDPDVAILLLSGIISDTVNLQSPTTTEPDRRAIYRLETITGISASEQAKRLFAQLNALENREPKEIILADYKQYNHEGVAFAIGQVEVTTLADSGNYRTRLVDALENVTREKGLRWCMLMVTDVMKRNSLLLTSGYVDAEQLLPFSHIADQTFDMPGVLSRKKQLLPEVMRVLSEVGS